VFLVFSLACYAVFVCFLVFQWISVCAVRCGREGEGRMKMGLLLVLSTLALGLAPPAAALVGEVPPPPLPPLPVGPRAPTVIPQAPKPNWSWDHIPT
jgi:hypothetical protein